MELRAHRSYKELDHPIQFWRTKAGFEVDFVLGDGSVALEVKSTSRVADRDLHALRAFSDEFKPRHTLVVCNEPAERLVGKIRITPWKVFLQRLWDDVYVD
jgi:predicted AAA+ superfamily ATPase